MQCLQTLQPSSIPLQLRVRGGHHLHHTVPLLPQDQPRHQNHLQPGKAQVDALQPLQLVLPQDQALCEGDLQAHMQWKGSNIILWNVNVMQ